MKEFKGQRKAVERLREKLEYQRDSNVGETERETKEFKGTTERVIRESAF